MGGEHEDIKLDDADDSVEITLADGSTLTVTGDGIVALFIDSTLDDPTTVVNMYVPDEDGNGYWY